MREILPQYFTVKVSKEKIKIEIPFLNELLPIVDSKEVMDNMEDLDFRIKILILLILSLARIRNSA